MNPRLRVIDEDGRGHHWHARMTATKSDPELSVVVCTYNRSALLEKTLRSFPGVEAGFPVELIIVDNNSSDDTREVVQSCRGVLEDKFAVSYVFEPVQGLSAARNSGVTAAKGDIIAFIDDDAVPCREWLTSIRDFFVANTEADALGGPIEPNFEIPKPAWLTPALEPYYSILDLGTQILPFPDRALPFGASMAFRRAALGEKPFPEHLGRKGNILLSHEETTVFKGLIAKGRHIFYHPGMRVHHFIPKERLTEEWILERLFYEGVSNALTQLTPGQKLILFAKNCLRYAALYLTWPTPSSRTRLVFKLRDKNLAGVFAGLIGPLSKLADGSRP